jgi:hypothetical protein
VWWFLRSISVTRTGYRSSVRAASSPPKPPPITTTRGFALASIFTFIRLPVMPAGRRDCSQLDTPPAKGLK